MKDRLAQSTQLRYAVLLHSGVDEPHFDLLIETARGSDLATWRSPVWPIETPTLLTRLKDHRRIYLDYQGDLSDHRGSVRRIADGIGQLEIDGDGRLIFQAEQGLSLVLKPFGGDQWEASRPGPGLISRSSQSGQE